MTKPKKPKRNPNRTSFKPGNPYAFKPKAEHDDVAALPSITDASGEYTREALARVVKLASLDKSAATIANAIGMTVKEFEAACQSNPALAHAHEVGVGLSCDYHLGQLRKLGRKNFIPSIYIAKALHGLTDTPEVIDERGPRITIVLPGAQPTTQLVEGQRIPDDRDDVPGLIVVDVPPRANGAAVPALPTTTVPCPSPHPSDRAGTPAPTPSPPPQSAAVRNAVREFEFSVGLNTLNPTRADFLSEAAWKKWNKQR